MFNPHRRAITDSSMGKQLSSSPTNHSDTTALAGEGEKSILELGIDFYFGSCYHRSIDHSTLSSQPSLLRGINVQDTQPTPNRSHSGGWSAVC
jgi:hypothetical protein